MRSERTAFHILFRKGTAKGSAKAVILWQKGNRSVRKTYKQGLASRVTASALQVFNTEREQFLKDIGETTLSSEHKHLKCALQCKASDMDNFPFPSEGRVQF